MRKIICILLSVVISATSLSISVFADDEIKVCINGERVEFDTEPTIINGRTFVPIRAVCEKLGADVYWWEDDEVVMIVKNDIKILLQIENNEMVRFECRDYEHLLELWRTNTYGIAYEKAICMDVMPVILNGRTLLPIRYVCEELGAIVEWEADTSTVNIKCLDEILQSSNKDKSFFDAMCLCEDNFVKISTTAQTNEERIEKAIYFLELYFKTDALSQELISPVDDLNFEIKNTAIYKLNSEYPQDYDTYYEEWRQYDGKNVDYIVNFEGNQKVRHSDGSYYYIRRTYAVTFYKNSTCGLGLELNEINRKQRTRHIGVLHPNSVNPPFEDDLLLVHNYGTKYNQTITYPSTSLSKFFKLFSNF